MKSEAASFDALNDDSVVRYLREHADFFGRHPTLLTDLSLPHDSGQAISLVERQVAINDALFEKTRRFTLTMLDADGLDAVDECVARTLIDDFAADHARCFFTHPTVFGSRPHLIYCSSAQELPLFHLTQGAGISCGMLRNDEFRKLFGNTTRIDGSAALIQIRHGDVIGVLAIGSNDPARFSPDMGTLFIRYIGDVLSRVLARLLGHDDAR
jgi:uncharacterized protein